MLGRIENVILLLLIIELFSWLFIIIISSGAIFYYLILQSYFLLWSLIGIVGGNFILLIVRMFLKIGLPPIHSWVLHLFMVLHKIAFWFISTIHKLLPLIFLINLFSFRILNRSLVIIRIILRIVMSVRRITITLVLGYSSIIHTGWILFRCIRGMNLTLFYLIGYYFLLMTFLIRSRGHNLRLTIFNQNSLLSYTWLVLSGLPPFLMFWLKMSVLIGLFYLVIESFLLIVTLIVTILAYFRVFSLNLIREQSFYQIFTLTAVLRLCCLTY
jgi:NADH:ubiquinone oxidoreductase subunit 2 (subunit N)